MLVLWLSATPAGAVVAKIGTQGYGVTPINGVNTASLLGAYRASSASGVSGTAGARNQDGLPFGGTPLVSVGGPVMHSTTTHVIYWDPSKEFKATTKGIVSGFFTNVAHDSGLTSNVFAVAGQYTDTTGHAAYSSGFGGALVDEQPYPTSGNCTVPNEVDKGPYVKCLFDAQLKTELSAYIGAHSLPTGPTQLYFLLLPHSIATCLPQVIEGKQVCSNNFFCAYHSYVSPGTASEIIYADIPFSLLDTNFVKGCQDDGHNANIQQPNPDSEGGENVETRFADVALKYISHEAIEAITDPLVNNQTAWVDAEGQEIGDKCNGVSGNGSGVGYDPNSFLPVLGGEVASNNLFNQSINTGSYYLQSEWDNGAKACTMRPVPLSAAGFQSSPGSGGAGTPVGFSGTAVDAYGGLEFAWTFGDGSTATGASPRHTFAAPGIYTVTMTTKDGLTGSTTAPVSHSFVVHDQPTASFSISPNPASAGSSVSVNAGASSDPDGSIVSYIWNFGDGSNAGGVTQSHTYAVPGTYGVALIVNDSGGQSASTTLTVTVGPAVPTTSTVVTPNSTFTGRAAFNAKTGVITLTESVGDPGTFSWLFTFPNGRFGAFASRSAKCKSGYIRLNGRCRPAKVTFAKGSQTVSSAGSLSVTVRPSASALKALKNALKQHKGVPVTMSLTFQSARGGSPVSHTQSLVVKLKR